MAVHARRSASSSLVYSRNRLPRGLPETECRLWNEQFGTLTVRSWPPADGLASTSGPDPVRSVDLPNSGRWGGG